MKKFLSMFVVLLVLFGLTPAVNSQEVNQRVIALFKDKVDKNIAVQAQSV